VNARAQPSWDSGRPATEGGSGAAPLPRAVPRLPGPGRRVRAPPGLRAGAIELGASWVVGLLRNVDHAQRSFARSEPDLKALPLKPSEYLRLQVRFTPFPFEDTAWLIDQCGPELFMFSTDYPHPEGGRHPFEIFGEALAGFDDDARDRFFWRNGAELLGIS